MKKNDLLQGIKWTISKKLFAELGPRLTGSIAVTIIPSKLQSPSEGSEEEPGDIQLMPMPIRAAAVMHLHPPLGLGKGERVHLPKEGFLKLKIQPRTSGIRPDRDSNAGTTA